MILASLGFICDIEGHDNKYSAGFNLGLCYLYHDIIALENIAVSYLCCLT